MKEFKGTPGPWEVSHHFSDTVTVLDSRGYRMVTAEDVAILENYSEKLNVHHWADDERASLELSEEEQAANAYLIATAPEMLKVLQTLYCTWKEKGTLHLDFDDVHRVIKKALGDA